MTFLADDSRVDDVTTETDGGVGIADADVVYDDERCCCCCIFNADKADDERERRVTTLSTSTATATAADDDIGVTQTDALSTPKFRIPKFLHELSKKGASHSQVTIQ